MYSPFGLVAILSTLLFGVLLAVGLLVLAVIKFPFCGFGLFECALFVVFLLSHGHAPGDLCISGVFLLDQLGHFFLYFAGFPQNLFHPMLLHLLMAYDHPVILVVDLLQVRKHLLQVQK